MKYVINIIIFVVIILIGTFLFPPGDSSCFKKPFTNVKQDILSYYVALPKPKKRVVSYFSNRRGNRNFLYRGETYKVAYFAGSTGLQSEVDYIDTFIGRLQEKYGDVYIENFSKSSQKCNDIYNQLSKTKDKEFDLIIISIYCEANLKNKKKSLASVFQTPVKNFKLNPFKKGPIYTHSKVNLDDVPSTPISPLAFENRWLRVYNKVQFVYEPFLVNSSKENKIFENANKVFAMAQKKGKKVIYLKQFLAWHPKMHPGVRLRWRTLYPAKKFPQRYKNEKSIYDSYEYRYQSMLKATSSAKIEVIDPSSELIELIKESDHYFLDKWHFTALGSAKYSKILDERIFSKFFSN